MMAKKALEILELNIKEAGSKMPPDVKDALNLGKEALLRHIERHHHTFSGMMAPLPGETGAADSP